MVSLYRGESSGRFRYLSLTSRGTNLLVVREVLLASSGREILSAHELYFRYGLAVEMDHALASLMESRFRSGFQVIYAHLPEIRLPRCARLLRASQPSRTPTLADWITACLPPSSEC